MLLTEQNVPPVDPPGLALGFIILKTATETSPPGLAATWRDGVSLDIEEEFELGASPWSAYLASKSKFEAGLRAVLTPDGRLDVEALGDPSLSARAGFRMRDPEKAPIGLFGLAGELGSRPAKLISRWSPRDWIPALMSKSGSRVSIASSTSVSATAS